MCVFRGELEAESERHRQIFTTGERRCAGGDAFLTEKKARNEKKLAKRGGKWVEWGYL